MLRDEDRDREARRQLTEDLCGGPDGPKRSGDRDDSEGRRVVEHGKSSIARSIGTARHDACWYRRMAASAPVGNHVLDGLPEEERAQLAPQLERIRLVRGQLLIPEHAPIDRVYFPVDCVCSILALTEGPVLEVGTVGRESMLGLPAFLGAISTPNRCLCQVGGGAIAMRASDLQRAVSNGGHLHARLSRLTQATFTLISQSAGCLRGHDVSQRCARWLLMTHDRVDANTFDLPAEFLAQMLGVDPPAVGVVAGELERQEIITWDGDQVTLLDRAALERLTCECYGIVRDEFARVG